MKADVVIGAGFGDEGKGLFTDFLASQYDESIVVRFNGGAQAGHTVVTPEGQRHVFSHIGSGSFCNSHTYLSQFFIVNPFMFFRELNELPFIPSIMIHPAALVTTPWDMMVNQLKDRKHKHGSVGMGINETVVRSQRYPLTVNGLNDVRAVSEFIRDHYVPERLQELNLEPNATEWEQMRDPRLMDIWLENVKNFLSIITISVLKKTSLPIIFEGAQGLLLDENHAFFPHVTRSSTGLTNVLTLAKQLGIDQLDVNYMIRAYMTRHGNGPFPTESKLVYEDRTNVPNAFQGTLRFGMFDYNLVRDAILNDRDHNSGWINTTNRLVVTHLDQVPPFVEYNHDGQPHAMDRQIFAESVAMDIGLDGYAESYGPTRKDIRCPTKS